MFWQTFSQWNFSVNASLVISRKASSNAIFRFFHNYFKCYYRMSHFIFSSEVIYRLFQLVSLLEFLKFLLYWREEASNCNIKESKEAKRILDEVQFSILQIEPVAYHDQQNKISFLIVCRFFFQFSVNTVMLFLKNVLFIWSMT
jgi:hypothetical protein